MQPLTQLNPDEEGFASPTQSFVPTFLHVTRSQPRMTKNVFLEEHSVSQLLPMNKYCGYQTTAEASVTNAIPEHHATFFR